MLRSDLRCWDERSTARQQVCAMTVESKARREQNGCGADCAMA